MHADAAAGHAHPVGKGCADVFITRAAIFPAISAVNASAAMVGGAEDGRAFIDDFFGDGVASWRGAFAGAAGADGGVNGDGFFGAD